MGKHFIFAFHKNKTLFHTAREMVRLSTFHYDDIINTYTNNSELNIIRIKEWLYIRNMYGYTVVRKL